MSSVKGGQGAKVVKVVKVVKVPRCQGAKVVKVVKVPRWSPYVMTPVNYVTSKLGKYGFAGNQKRLISANNGTAD
jgi:hypothetical protein